MWTGLDSLFAVEPAEPVGKKTVTQCIKDRGNPPRMRIVYNISESYGGNPPMEVGKPFWSDSGVPRVVVMLSGDRFDPGPEWKEWRIPLLEFFLEGQEEDLEWVSGHVRAEIARIQAEKEVSHG